MAQSPTGPEAPGGRGADHESEIAKYEAMLAQDPKSRAFALLAEAYRKSGRFDQAIQAAGDGLKLYPYYLSGRVALARAYFDAGQREQAREEFEKVISAAPDNLLAHRHLAEIYLDAGKRIEAAKSLKMVVLLDPRDEKARGKLNSITPGTRAPAPPGDDFSALLDSHRHEAPASPPAPVAAIPTLTDQEIIQQPELSSPAAPPVPPVKAAPAGEAFGEIEVPDFAEEPLFEPEALPGVRQTGQAAPVPPVPAPPAPAAPSPIQRAATRAPEPEPAAPPASPWDEIAEEVLPQTEPADELNTETLAEIYVQQGFYDKALAIYQKLAHGQQGNARLLQKAEELRSLVKMAVGPPWGGGTAQAPAPGARTAPVAAPPVRAPAAGTPPERKPPAAVKPARDEEALKTLRLWMDRIKTEKR